MEERLKILMQELGNAINDSLSDSDRIAEAIGEALEENGKVIVTGCLGAKDGGAFVRMAHPKVLAVTGPHQYEAVVAAVHEAAPLREVSEWVLAYREFWEQRLDRHRQRQLARSRLFRPWRRYHAPRRRGGHGRARSSAS